MKRRNATMSQVIFAGPTKEQVAKMNAKQQIEKAYMQWLRAEGHGCTIEEAKHKYAELTAA